MFLFLTEKEKTMKKKGLAKICLIFATSNRTANISHAEPALTILSNLYIGRTKGV